MSLWPDFHLGVWNGWIPFLLYLAGLLLAVARFPRETRDWLFYNPKDSHMGAWLLVRICGQFTMVAYIVMMIFTPLQPPSPFLYIGGTIVAIGFLLVMWALRAFRQTPVGQPVAQGPYRFSRNPQWVGLFLISMGAAMAAGIALYVGMVALVGLIYHKQILDEEAVCLEKYGETYRAYKARIPRYFLF